MSRGWKVLLVTSVGVYLVALDVTIVNIAFPAISTAFGDASRAALQWILSGYNLGFAASLLMAGQLADRYGRRRIFYTGIAVFTLASAASGLAPTLEFLMAARVVQGLGGALVVPSALALVLPEFPVERRSAAIGIWGAIGGIAAATGPSLGSVLVQGIGWRAVFFVNVPACLGAWLAGRRLLVESRDPTARGLPDVAGAVLATGAVALLVFGIAQTEHWGWTDPRTLTALGAVLVLVPAVVMRSRTHPVPIIATELFGLRFFTVANAAAFLFSVAFFGMLLLHVLFLTSVWGYPILVAGLALTPGPLSAAAVAGPAGRLADRVGHRYVVPAGVALFAAGLWSLAVWVGPEPDYWGLFFPLSLVTGTGIGLTIATIVSAANAYLPPERYGMGSAFNATMRQVGAAVGVASVVALLGRPDAVGLEGAFARAWTTMAFVALGAGVLMLWFYRRPSLAQTAERSPDVGVLLDERPGDAEVL